MLGVDLKTGDVVSGRALMASGVGNILVAGRICFAEAIIDFSSSPAWKS